MLEVPYAVLVLRSVHTVNEIVIHREHLRAHPVHQQLYLESFGESSLSGRRSSGDKDDLRPLLSNRIGYLRDFLLVQRLRQFDQLKGFILFACHIEVTDIIDAQQFVPAVVLLEDGEHLILRHLIFEHRRVVTIRDTNQQTVLEEANVEYIDIPRTGQQHIRVIVDIIAHPEITAVGVAQRLEDR